MKRPNYYGLQYAGDRRVKRTWVRTAVMLLVLFLLSMLAGWVAMKYKCSVLSAQCLVSESPLLLAGVPDWIAVGIVGMVVALVLARLAWGAFEDAQRTAEYLSENEGDPLAETAVGLVPEEVARIVDACRREARAVLMLVEAAQTALCADDVTDMLRLAHGRMEQVVRTLGELQREVGMGPEFTPQRLDNRRDEAECRDEGGRV